MNWCKIYVFTSNIMVLHHKISQTLKIKLNRYTNIYLLMNLFKINQFIPFFFCISALLSVIQQKNFLNHFVFLLLIVWDFLWCKGIIFKVKTSILHQFTELKASGRYFIWDRISYGWLFIRDRISVRYIIPVCIWTCYNGNLIDIAAVLWWHSTLLLFLL